MHYMSRDPRKEGFRTLSEALELVGGLGKPSKMPGYAYGLPATKCPVGSKLVNIPGSVCSNCYALKGRYIFSNVKTSHERRLLSLTNPRWVDAMAFLINRKKCDYFRWHDSGDLQGGWHLSNIVKVANRCPNTLFWLPTREKALVRRFLATHKTFPDNLIVRVSATFIDGEPPKGFTNTSTVLTDGSHTCPAYKQDGKCGDCRACWDSTVQNVSYPNH